MRNPSLLARSQSEEANSTASSTSSNIVLPASLVYGTPFSRILYYAGIVPTKSEGTRTIAKGGAYVAGTSAASQKIEAEGRVLGSEEERELHYVQLKDQKPEDVSRFVRNGVLIFRIGKWKVRAVQVVEDAEFDAWGLDAPGWDEYKKIKPRT